MKSIIKRSIVTLTLALSVGVGSLALAPVSSTGAIDVFSGSCNGGNGGGGGGGSSELCGATKQDDAPTLIKNVINLLLYLVGIIAVIAIIIGGIRYATSNGDSGATKAAKDTILYAVVGIVVAIMAFAIVNFISGAFS